tara:strand:+ start:266 stop:394 length:129 start_codon:yes stop_codon:yes gene_type:complete
MTRDRGVKTNDRQETKEEAARPQPGGFVNDVAFQQGDGIVIS